MTTQKLLDAIDADADGAAFPASGSSKILAVWATDFGGGTVTLEASPDGGTTWITVTIAAAAITLTANGYRVIDRTTQGMVYRATLTGSTNPTDVSAYLFD
jgi:hypothetical protein